MKISRLIKQIAFDQTIRKTTKLYGNIREIFTGHGDDYTIIDYLTKVI